ncbi:hypothetical protein PR001_g2358 [Phytophthora rubi]|uniref:DUF6818 domain-containing protein n=1 Tax=Phytophthora rubi TaxID=129364 RepID=A0A6A3PCT5_9STRA|nr:hypothetical protein PR001_g2358 [Phytophthora rubi]
MYLLSALQRVTFANARQSRFCNEINSAFVCGNAMSECSALAILRNVRTGMRGLDGTAAVPAREVVGEYLDHVQLFGPPCRNAPANEGFKMHHKTRTAGNKFVGIDALEKGGFLRLRNHSCNTAARFREVQTGDKRPVSERRAGYQNYTVYEQMFLCSAAAEFKPLGRNMWKEVALEYNSRRGRSWLERDYDSLRQKFLYLYGKMKPTGDNDGLPPKLLPIALAHEVQHAIEMKAGAHTSHDRFNRDQDDAAPTS